MKLTPAQSLVLGAAVLAAAVWVGLCAGTVPVGPVDAASALVSGGGDGGDPRAVAVVTQIRLPRIVGALCVGASLGVAGTMLQALLRNPLASPFVIGTSAAASFGAVLGIFVGLPHAASVVASFAFAAAGSAIVIAWSRVGSRLPDESVVLTGFGVGLLFSSATGLLQVFSREETQLREMVLRLLGGLWGVTWGPLAFHVPATLLALVAAGLLARRLDVLSLGEEDARRLGLDVLRTRILVLLTAAALTSLAVSLAGIVAFAGLVVPHIARRFVGVRHAVLVPAAAIGGALFITVADTAARTAFVPHELPLGIVTSLVGAPVFLGILRATQRRESFL